jgi:hypothetical protein
VQVAFLAEDKADQQTGPQAIDQDAPDDEDDLLLGLANHSTSTKPTGSRVELKTGAFNPRKEKEAHSKTIAADLARGVVNSRGSPLFIAISKGDIVNVKDFVPVNEARTAKNVPVVQWGGGVRETMVLAGQHRMAAARAATADLVKELVDLDNRIPEAEEMMKTTEAAYQKANANTRTLQSVLTDKEVARNTARDSVQAMKNRQIEIRVLMDKIRFWPAIFYDKGERFMVLNSGQSADQPKMDSQRTATHTMSSSGFCQRMRRTQYILRAPRRSYWKVYAGFATLAMMRRRSRRSSKNSRHQKPKSDTF